MCSLRVLPNTVTTRQPPFYINGASIVGRKISSTVNTQLSFSFSTRPLTVNSQQSTIIPVQPELILDARKIQPLSVVTFCKPEAFGGFAIRLRISFDRAMYSPSLKTASLPSSEIGSAKSIQERQPPYSGMYGISLVSARR